MGNIHPAPQVLDAVDQPTSPEARAEPPSSRGTGQGVVVERDRAYLQARLLLEERRRTLAEARVHELESSLSWRLTRPVRWFSARVPAVARLVRTAGRRLKTLPKRESSTPSTADASEPEADRRILAASTLFDDAWYRSQTASAGPTRDTAIAHYLAFGGGLGLDPHPLFASAWYLDQNPDVAVEGANPLAHYLRVGDAQGRDPHPLFSVSWFRAQQPAAASALRSSRSLSALEDYLACGGVATRPDPHPLFWARWYSERYLADDGQETDPLLDYLTQGARLDRDPNPFFDTAWYRREAGAQLRGDEVPLIHYLRVGAFEGLRPNPGFNPLFVKRAASGLDLMVESPLTSEVRRLLRGSYAGRGASASDLATAVVGHVVAPVAVTVGVVAHRTLATDLEILLRSLRTSDLADGAITIELLLLANDGADTAAVARSLGFARVFEGANAGFGAGHNRLMKEAFSGPCDLYVAANPDGFFHPECIRHLAAAAQVIDYRGLVEAAEFPQEHPKIFDPYELETPWACGACLGIPRVVWEATGGFDEQIFMYCEDVDLSWRARLAGLKVLHIPNALYCHDVSGRAADTQRHLLSLTSARYLADKWNLPLLREATVSAMRTAGARAEPQRKADVERVSSETAAMRDFSGAEAIADQRHGLEFAPVRWRLG